MAQFIADPISFQFFIIRGLDLGFYAYFSY